MLRKLVAANATGEQTTRSKAEAGKRPTPPIPKQAMIEAEARRFVETEVSGLRMRIMELVYH